MQKFELPVFLRRNSSASGLQVKPTPVGVRQYDYEHLFYRNSGEAQTARVDGCLSSIILSPLNGYVEMSPYGDIHVEPERIATSGGCFFLRRRGSRTRHARAAPVFPRSRAPPGSAPCGCRQH